jgi:hypothetical protein
MARQCLYGDFSYFYLLIECFKTKTTKKLNQTRTKEETKIKQTNKTKTKKTKEIFCDYEVQHINQ